MKNNRCLIVLIAVLIAASLYAQDGILDNSFGVGGFKVIDIGSDLDIGNSISVQTDGKILFGGTSRVQGDKDFALLRLNVDGSLDDSFGNGGISLVDFDQSVDDLSDITIRADGKIISVGRGGSNIFDFAIACYNTDGTLDQNFGENGRVITDVTGGFDQANSIVSLSNNKFIVSGSSSYPGGDSDFTLVKYNENGTIDESFGDDGIVRTDISNNSSESIKAVEILSNGNILAVGFTGILNVVDEDFAIVKYDSTGSLDSTFGLNGVVVVDFEDNFDLANDLVVQSDGKIIIVGYSKVEDTRQFSATRLNVDGSIDADFGDNGKKLIVFNESLINEGNSVEIQGDGKILISGYSKQSDLNSFSIVRLLSNGQIDSTFGNQGFVITDFNVSNIARDMLIRDNDVLVGGYISLNGNLDFIVGRYNIELLSSSSKFLRRNVEPSIYPNPVREDAYLQFQINNTCRLSLYLVDQNGRLVKSYFDRKRFNFGLYNYDLQVKNMPIGSYYLMMDDGRDVYTQKLIKL